MGEAISAGATGENPSLWMPETAFKPGDAVTVVSDCEMEYHDGTLFLRRYMRHQL